MIPDVVAAEVLDDGVATQGDEAAGGSVGELGSEVLKSREEPTGSDEPVRSVQKDVGEVGNSGVEEGPLDEAEAEEEPFEEGVDMSSCRGRRQ